MYNLECVTAPCVLISIFTATRSLIIKVRNMSRLPILANPHHSWGLNYPGLAWSVLIWNNVGFLLYFTPLPRNCKRRLQFRSSFRSNRSNHNNDDECSDSIGDSNLLLFYFIFYFRGRAWRDCAWRDESILLISQYQRTELEWYIRGLRSGQVKLVMCET